MAADAGHELAGVRDQAQAPIRVALLGSTGSIGRQALEVLSSAKDQFEVVAMAAGSDAATFSAQLAEARPRVAALADETAAPSLEVPSGTKLERAPDALEQFATREDVDWWSLRPAGLSALAEHDPELRQAVLRRLPSAAELFTSPGAPA